ncbi:carboxypeptidase-like regulatory domain-containing protein [Halalkalicoccus ordinarius]|uniref:carboxypeptidase-like regulatory domain-containing protein n=1 Tax=Halalkalicoccus ordinarius TaxID=3116651 RepID=UPI00300E8F7B
MIEPDGTYTIQFQRGEKALNEDGGVIRLYDADGDRIGSWDHVGSPSAPPAASDAEDVGYVQVMVLDARNGEGEDAEVVLTNESGETLDGTTDGAGVTTVQEVPYGEYELTITHDEYADHDETIVVDEERTETTIELDPSETVTRTSAVEPTSTVVVRSSLHTPS